MTISGLTHSAAGSLKNTTVKSFKKVDKYDEHIHKIFYSQFQTVHKRNSAVLLSLAAEYTGRM